MVAMLHSKHNSSKRLTSFASRSLPKYKKGSIGVAFASITDDEEPSQSSPEPEGVSSNYHECPS
ncbi:hypothetical protein DERP_000292 [Dermatophagoides pteronyssinus]|uniref:Uncharacterized protein n=1 Tax=Dermatophagoides pteronyssinus TaxID=6956 RepID=A0ABQ8J0C4_DERPT|nr:hypothetical protein DERP_000292 [Dermatophagoides pteronyssinus]